MINLKYIYRAFRYRFFKDKEEINFALKHLKLGDTVVDIGCHKGGYLYWFQRGVGRKGKVVAFEPQVILFDYLTKTVKQSNVIFENKGLSNEKGQMTFFIPKTKSGTSPGATLENKTNESDFNKIEVQVTTLDDYFLSKKIQPTLIKIDVEGHEEKVLKGGLQLLKQCQPIILMECEQRHLVHSSIFEVFKILTNIGYQGFFFQNGQMISIREFQLDKHQQQGEGRFWEENGYVNNFVFLKKIL